MYFCDQCDAFFDTAHELKHHIHEQHEEPS